MRLPQAVQLALSCCFHIRSVVPCSKPPKIQIKHVISRKSNACATRFVTCTVSYWYGQYCARVGRCRVGLYSQQSMNSALSPGSQPLNIDPPIHSIAQTNGRSLPWSLESKLWDRFETVTACKIQHTYIRSINVPK